MATSMSPSSAVTSSSATQRSVVTLQQLSSFAMRNLAIPGSGSGELMDLYFKLVIDGHVVYVSEIVRNTLNPVWMPFEPETLAHVSRDFDGTHHPHITQLFCGTSFLIVVVRVRNYKLARRKSAALAGKIMADEGGDAEAEAADDNSGGSGEFVEQKQPMAKQQASEPTTGFVFSGVNKTSSRRGFDYDDEEAEEEEEEQGADGNDDNQEKKKHQEAVPAAATTAAVVQTGACTALAKSTLAVQPHPTGPAALFEEDILHIAFNIRELDPLPIGLTEIANLPLNTCLLEFNGRIFVKREVVELLVEMGVISAKHSRRKGSAIQLKEYSLHDGLDNLERIRALKKHVDDVTDRNAALQETIKQKLAEAEASVHKDHQRVAVQERIQSLRRQISDKSNALSRVKAVMQDERRTFETDIHIPKALLSMMQMSSRYKDEKQGILERRCEVLRAAHKIRSRQAMLVKELGAVYPIEYVGAGEYTIRGIKITNSDLTIAGRADEEQLTTALGYMAHLVFMLSKYLHVNLRYKIIPYSSRSYLKDDINDPHGEYPLYRKGVERERFERAIFFLRKNVEQLLFARGLDPTQGNPLLGRLKTLTEAEVTWLAAEHDVGVAPPVPEAMPPPAPPAAAAAAAGVQR